MQIHVLHRHLANEPDLLSHHSAGPGVRRTQLRCTYFRRGFQAQQVDSSCTCIDSNAFMLNLRITFAPSRTAARTAMMTFGVTPTLKDRSRKKERRGRCLEPGVCVCAYVCVSV
jgi:hypothetical protein